MSKADQIFEKIGYEKSEYKDSNLEDIFYRKKDRQWREDGEIEICMNNNEQQITIEFMCSEQLPAFIGMKEIEAIHEKIKELRMGGKRMKGKRFKKGERVMLEKVEKIDTNKKERNFVAAPSAIFVSEGIPNGLNERTYIDGIPAEDYGTPNSRTTYPGEINIGETLKSNLEYWRKRCFELQKEIEERETRLQEEINENCKLKFELYGNSISKSKIRAKIEEMEKEKEKYFEKQVIQHEIEVLQSLLKKE